MIRLVLAFIALLFASEASAQLAIVQQHQPDGPYSGSGCCIGRTSDGCSLFLTAAHCVSGNGKITVLTEAGNVPATVLVSTGFSPDTKDWGADIALLSVADGNIPIQELGDTVEVGDAVCMNGFAGSTHRGLRHTTCSVIEVDGDAVVTSKPTEHGESGGPICDKRNRVIGVISAHGKKRPITIASNIGAIRRVCGRHLGQPMKTLKSVELYHFSAPWCVPCQLMEPVVRKLKASGMPIKDINTDTDPQLTKKMGVSAVPAFVVVKDGKPVDRIVGPSTEGMLRRMYERHAVVKADCAKPDEAPPPPEETKPPLVPVPDPISTPQCDCKALEAKIAELEASKKKLEAELAELKNTPPPPVVEPKPEKRVLYFTSIGNPNTTETDKAARKLKDNGYPITIITLDPTETNVRDVPRTHELPSGKSVVGASNVITYLAMLTKG